MRCRNCRLRRSNVVQRPSDFRQTIGIYFDPNLNSFPPLITPAHPPQPKRRRSIPPGLPSTSRSPIIDRAVEFLLQEHESRVRASGMFPQDISTPLVRQSIARFEKEMAVSSRDIACCTCGMLIPSNDTRRFLDGDPVLEPLAGFLDRCGYIDGFWNLCSGCHAPLLRGSVPKFSAGNKINVVLCQHYPEALKDLTLTEEYLIAKSHPVGVVLKLRPGGRSSPASYYALRGHFIIIPQDPKPLLRILPSPDLHFAELIKVFWLGKISPTTADLQPFFTVRKHKVLAALRYLVRHNPLYGNVTIDHSAVNHWPDEFIPSDIQQQVICVDNTDHHERAGYSVNLQEGNYENDWQAAEDNHQFIDDSLPVTGSVTTDLNGDRQNPDLRLLNTVFTLVNDPPLKTQPQFAPTSHASHSSQQPTAHQRVPTIEYRIHGQVSLLNQWDDPHYLTSAFPTLFPGGIGGHLDDRAVTVSLVAFANWALRHHSRRFARHRTFMYLLYDIIQLRNSCLGNSLLIKRSQWTSVARDLDSLNVDRLQKAAEELSTNQTTSDPLIRRLLKNITAIGVQVPGSFFQKLQIRAELRGLLVREGMPAFWLTINPSDLQNPLVLVLAGVQCSSDLPANVTSAIQSVTATSDPVAVARFFHCTCKAVLNGLLGSKTADIGILGDVSNYFGVVESNGRGMLHLHTLVWTRGNLGFVRLRDRVLADGDFANRMITFLGTVVMHSLHGSDEDDESTLSNVAPPSTGQETDSEFMRKLFYDSNRVARTKQLHSKRHTATCFKYRPQRSNNHVCRFGMPRDLLDAAKVDEYGIIHLARNHAWVNPWNPSIATCIRSNHDISWIPTVSKSLSLLYYITNYATKDDVSPCHMVTKAALLKQMIEHAAAAPTPSTVDIRLRQRGMDKFALRCFNSLSQDREISGVQVASTLLQLPSYYTLNYNFTRINLWWLRRYVRSLIPPGQSRRDTLPSDTIGEEPCNYEQTATAPANIFDNYKLRGSHLSSLSIFEYCMVVRTKRLQDATTEDIPFEDAHPRHRTHIQRLAQSPFQTATVTLQGELTEFQSSEDSVPDGNPTTTAIQNDLAEILLGLFIPWQNLPSLFQQTHPPATSTHDILHHVWTCVEPTLPPHIRTFAENVELLRKSKSDCQADAILRSRTNERASPIDQELGSPPYPASGSENEDPHLPQNLDGSLTKETLLAAFLAISRRWTNEAQDAQRQITTLASFSFTLTLQLQNLRPLHISDSTLYQSSGLSFFPVSTLNEWQDQIKNFTRLTTQDPNTASSTSAVPDLDDSNIDLIDNVLLPVLAGSDALPDLLHLRSRVGQNLTGFSVTSLVRELIPLNEKQCIVVEKVLTEILNCTDHPYDHSQRKQTLLYVGGEGGVGKSQIIKATTVAMDLLHRKNEIILMAPTGAAADVIGGSTYHTSLGISLNRYRRTGVGQRVRRLWTQKTIMFIDEVSMVDLSALSIINTHCKIARSLERSSPDLFGGLPVVILMGDFYQFPPVQGQPLWKPPRNETEQDGKLIWNQFKQVIILDEQMRQAEDLPYRNILTRARTATLTHDDILVLNSKAITSLDDPRLHATTAVVKLNALRHIINRFQIERFARSKRQRILIFPALHTRTRSSAPTDLTLHADDLLGLPEQGAKIPFPGLILYTLSMPTMLLTNICTPAGLVNGATGEAVGVVVDPDADFHELDELYTFCTKPPACLLFKPSRSKSISLPSLSENVLPIFPLEASITVKGFSVRRRQVPICPAFCLTDYKIQGTTLESAILDLKNDRKIRGQDAHRRFCSTYVQLSRLRSLAGLHLLQPIEMSDLQHAPDPQLLGEMQRLRALELNTLAAWQSDTSRYLT
ncbi:uncharacterized protein N7498_007876 [Penicillium cinerascens]|uniref:ATP-dependent DNA helicase n=1 Tax=Penicillium cinerascens TaxID=70096 RepID=A0A9W9MED7_9EURO|nr:uncharacterized protein N7498_007876 [Penicillium cinerascens]KAJ5198759.1 hypothetical protein N7498_007876 [Penicillium cinerascens]